VLLGGALLIVLVAIAVQIQAGRDGFVLGRFNGRPASDGATDRQLDPPPYAEMARITMTGDGVLSVDAPAPLSHLSVPVAVNPPPEAILMQLADNVGFLGADWQPVADRVDVAASSAGYQVIFGRFVLVDGSISSTSVTGVEIDPTYAAATSSADGSRHEPSWVQPFSAGELAVRVEAGRLVRGTLEPYDLDNPPAGDRIVPKGSYSLIERGGLPYGLTVSERRDVIRRGDELIGRPLDVEPVLNDAWAITSADDPAYTAPLAPTSIRHLARPEGGGQSHSGATGWAVVHDLVVTVPTPLSPGATYTLTPSGTVAPITFTYDPATMLSPAVRVAHTGIGTADRPKVGYLAGWFDGMGITATADTNPTFTVVDTETGEAVHQGVGRLRPRGDEMGRGDLTGTPVVELDFSPVTVAGRYQLCVEAIGCSHPFAISDDVWLQLADTVARAIYHQRSGVELGPPYTPLARPRPYHPDDGIVVRESRYSLLEAQSSTTNTSFADLVAGATGSTVDQAWGGHFDAGDWDRRINHLWYVRTATMLVDLYPDLFGNRNLNIPESGDAVPDVLDEALWSLDFYRRLQRGDGAISGGVEASAHPPPNSTSWTDDLAVFRYEPDIYSSYIYAGVAAEVANVLQRYDPERADRYVDSADRAMDWAESQWPSVDDDLVDFVRAQRNVAAAAMLATTGDSRWHDIFVATAPYLDPPEPVSISCHAHSQCDAAWLYLRAPDEVTDPDVRRLLLDMFRRSGDAIVDAADTTAYGWTTEEPTVPLVWGLGSGGSAHTNGLLRAYILTGEERYRDAAVRSAQVALGANPQNRALMTGVGREPVRHPQINDVKHGGLPPWPGVPVYGRHLLNAISDDSWVTEFFLLPAGAAPDPTEVPYLWQWYDVSSVAFFNEFTVHQGEADALWTFGVLAATSP
jgi:endoglucanase